MNRRNFIVKAGIASGISVAPGLLSAGSLSSFLPTQRINLGAITYSFRSMPSSAEDLLGYLTQLGLSSVELMGEPAEAYAGAPQGPAKRWGNLSEAEKQELDRVSPGNGQMESVCVYGSIQGTSQKV